MLNKELFAAAATGVAEAELAVEVAARRLHKALNKALYDMQAKEAPANIHDVLASIVLGTGATTMGEAFQQLQQARALLANRQALAYQHNSTAVEAAATNEDN